MANYCYHYCNKVSAAEIVGETMVVSVMLQDSLDLRSDASATLIPYLIFGN